MSRQVLRLGCAAAVCLCVTAITQANIMVYDDLWDVSRDTSIVAHSGVLASSDARNMIGFAGVGGEPSTMLFDDNKAAGSLHYIEWHTASPVRIESFNIVAAHDHNASDRRAFSRFDLFAWSGTEWTLLYTYSTAQPYGGGVNYTGTHFLELYDAVNTVSVAQDFRAEFIQRGDYSSARGPRILELDGFGTIMPEPATLGLVALGGLVLTRRRPRAFAVARCR